MHFDPDNIIVKYCAEGMELEGQGKPEDAREMFQKAWNESSADWEKSVSAHYLARHQKSLTDKLYWDETALAFALKEANDTMKSNFPSLYLNIAKCHEDLGDIEQAKKNYQLALSFTESLDDEGYGKMIRSGVAKGLERMQLTTGYK